MSKCESGFCIDTGTKKRMENLRQQVATLKSELLLQFERGWDKGFTESQAKFATLQKDNDTRAEDLTEAEGAVVDLMELNDSLTAEVEKKDNLLLLSKSVFTQECDRSHSLGESLEKAEAEVERLRVALETIGHECGNDLSGAAKEFIKQTLNHKEK